MKFFQLDVYKDDDDCICISRYNESTEIEENVIMSQEQAAIVGRELIRLSREKG